MCCTLEKARLSNTILYASEIELDGKKVHVLGYQNKAENLISGPNAMILPFPTSKEMGPENIIDTSNHKNILKDIAQATKERSFSDSDSLSYGSVIGRSIQIFDSGEYTVLLAESADLIPEALRLVPENKRPKINKDIFDAYAKWYPDWPIAVCCFEARQIDAAPLLWWYEPKDNSKLFLPSLDGHGAVPNLKEDVMLDHTVAVGSDYEFAGEVYYKDDIKDIKQFMPKAVIGKSFGIKIQNGDFVISLKDVNEGKLNLRRELPPGAA